MTIGRVMVTFLVIFSYPLQVHPCRNSVDKVIGEAVKLAGGSPSAFATLRYIVITVCILAFTLTVALFVNNLDIVFALVGATGSTTIGYILPGIFFFKLASGSWGAKRVAATLLALAGCCLMVICVSFIAYDAVEGIASGEEPELIA